MQKKYPIHNLIKERWSPRAMSGEPMTHEELMPLFEAARWAPSSYNEQPWRFLYAHRNSPHWEKFFKLLVSSNQKWVQRASVLVVVISKTVFERNGKLSITHSFDTGAAWENLALEGYSQGFVVHGMQGFDYELAKKTFAIPDTYKVEAMIAIGKKGTLELLDESLRGQEHPKERKPLEALICEGNFTFG